MAKIRKFNKATGKSEEYIESPEEIALKKQRTQEGQAYIQQREKLASQQGTTSTRAAQQLIPQEQAKLQAGIEEKQQQQKAIQLTELQKKQNEETKNLTDQYFNNQQSIQNQQIMQTITDEYGNAKQVPVPNQEQANSEQTLNKALDESVTAGVVTTGIVGSLALAPTIISSIPVITAKIGSVGKIGSAIGGAILGGGISKIIGGATGGRVAELEGDIKELVTSSRDISTDVKNGADPYQAIEILQKIEDEIIDVEGKLNVALKTDVNAWIKGKDETEFLFLQRNKIMRRRQALERFILTKNIAELDSGVEIPEN